MSPPQMKKLFFLLQKKVPILSKPAFQQCLKNLFKSRIFAASPGHCDGRHGPDRRPRIRRQVPDEPEGGAVYASRDLHRVRRHLERERAAAVGDAHAVAGAGRAGRKGARRICHWISGEMRLK
jgi:hypothetical protein